MPWAFISQDDAQVRIAFAAGDGWCTEPFGVQAEETDASVTITVWSKTDWSKTACPATFVGGAGTVTLARQLGDRQLVHAPVSRQWVPSASLLP